jgi:hypothetical protein
LKSASLSMLHTSLRSEKRGFDHRLPGCHDAVAFQADLNSDYPLSSLKLQAALLLFALPVNSFSQVSRAFGVISHLPANQHRLSADRSSSFLLLLPFRAICPELKGADGRVRDARCVPVLFNKYLLIICQHKSENLKHTGNFFLTETPGMGSFLQGGRIGFMTCPP